MLAILRSLTLLDAAYQQVLENSPSQPRRDLRADPSFDFSSRKSPREATSVRHAIKFDQFAPDHKALGIREVHPHHTLNISPSVRESQLVQDFDEREKTTSESQSNVEFALPASASCSRAPAPPYRYQHPHTITSTPIPYKTHGFLIKPDDTLGNKVFSAGHKK
ncbi:hypothetical protein H2248_003250 [Termitomyces sp. 'cryptogamus']|nr:hypothetical protein H2248_003250 [Termitomyces sp. 'cryptogamus']